MKKILFLIAFMSVAAVAFAGPYLGGGLEYAWTDRGDIQDYTPQPILLGGFEFGSGQVVFDLEASHGLPLYGAFNQDYKVSRFAQARAIVKFRF